MDAPAVAAPTASAPRRPFYPCLEGLRALGVTALFLQHSGYTVGMQDRSGLAWFGQGHLGRGASARTGGQPGAQAKHRRGTSARRLPWLRIATGGSRRLAAFAHEQRRRLSH